MARNRAKTDYLDDWKGGYVRVDSRGRKVYVIRKKIGPRRYHVSTGCHTEDAALEQLARFQANPRGYSPAGVAPVEGPTPLLLAAIPRGGVETDESLVGQFLRWSKNDKGNTPKYVNEQRQYMNWWTSKLDGVDLRAATLRDHVLPALEGASSRDPKIRTLKAFYGYLRKVRHLISAHEDPTFGTLAAGQSNPGKRKLKDKSFPKEHYQLAREHLVGHWRAGLDVLAGTGWHTTELKRFAEGGDIEALPTGATEGAGVLVCPKAKAGNEIRTAVSTEVLQAARELLKRASFDLFKFADAVKSACSAAGLKKGFTPGRFRHAVATWAINAGHDPAVVSAFLNHSSPKTTRTFYATHAVPKKVTTLL